MKIDFPCKDCGFKNCKFTSYVRIHNGNIVSLTVLFISISLIVFKYAPLPVLSSV